MDRKTLTSLLILAAIFVGVQLNRTGGRAANRDTPPIVLLPAGAIHTPAGQGDAPPACEFTPAPAAQTRPSTAPPALAAPRPVYTTRGALHIAQWLPGNRRLLLARDLPGTNRQAIETLDPFSGQVVSYGERNYTNSPPRWHPGQQAALYLDWAYTGANGRVAYRLLQNTQTLIENLPSPAFALTNRGELLLAAPQNPGDRLAPRPYSDQLLHYGSGEALLTEKKAACRLEVSPQPERGQPDGVLDARWSPAGRFLALITSRSAGSGIVLASELIVFDLQAGTVRRISTLPAIVTDIAWGPQGRWLAVLGVERLSDQGYERGALFLVEAESGAVMRAGPGLALGGGAWGMQLAWSGDGNTLAVGCPTPRRGRVCLIEVGP